MASFFYMIGYWISFILGSISVLCALIFVLGLAMAPKADKRFKTGYKNNAEDKTGGCAAVAFTIGIICAVLSFFINYDAFWGIFFPA
tara:strand:+ start:285 stop:545 length:261 start_codon:yes stop_codon:yes gene_type:complete